jgi:hypothetical protein
MAGQRDTSLDRAKAPCSELCVPCTERLAAGAQAPGDAHQGVTVLGQSLAADPSTSGDRRGLIARRRKASGRVEVFRAREALDRQRAGAERAALTIATPGSVVRICPGVLASSTASCSSARAMSCCSSCQRRRSAPRRCARNSASRGGPKSRFQRSVQKVAVASLVRPGALASNERLLGARPANAAAHASTA